MDIRKFETPSAKLMLDYKFKKEKEKLAERKKQFVFVRSYKNHDLYKHKKARLL